MDRAVAGKNVTRGSRTDLTRSTRKERTMPDEKQDQLDEIDDEMPDIGGAPCGDIFGTDTTIVTDDHEA